MTESESTEIIRRNLAAVHAEMEAACIRSGRSFADVRLVAVTKYAQWEWVQTLAEMHRVCGESRPQQLAERAPRIPLVEWHLIGHLQRNKVRLAIPHAAVIHSVDSLQLLQRVAEVAGDLSLRPQILLQVNVTGEATKSGFSVSRLQAEWPSVVSLQSRVDLVGLMTMAPASEDPEDARPAFRELAALREQLAAAKASREARIDLRELSMGMSGDFTVAIEEGSTMVRVGSRLFDGLT